MHTTLNRVFGFDALRPGQQRVVEAVLAGRNAAAIFPTGAGKSLCYQLPALLLPHLTLVISPLIALMHDQLQFLQKKGIAAASIDSAQSPEALREIYQRISRGELKILMISVERLKNERFRGFISQIPISLLVIDEAHCISEWGHNFRPDYLKLPGYQQALNIPQVLLLTATATPSVMEDMRRKFAIASLDVVRTGFYRPNLHLTVKPVAGSARLSALSAWLERHQQHSSIVYVTQQQSAEELAQALSAQGFSAKAYHAGMEFAERQQLQDQYMQGEVKCMVATIAFGMGIDKADIRAIAHYDLPKSIENFSQEIGRAGRDGLPADCLVLANRDSQNLLENFVYGDTPEPEEIAYVLKELAQLAPEGQWPVVLTRLSEASNIRQLPLKTLLVQLELQGLIAPLYAYFADYRFKLNEPLDTLLARFNPERQHFLQAIVQAASKARLWYSLDIDALTEQGHERSRVVKALEYLAQQNLITLESKTLTEVYRIHAPRSDWAALAVQLHGYFTERQHSEIARIDAMLALFASAKCLSAALAEYFADDQAPRLCGHCSVCLGQHQPLPMPEPLPALNSLDLQRLCAGFISSYQTNLGKAPSVVGLTRFLCGVLTPALTRLRVRAMPGFGALKDYPYDQVRRWLTHVP